MQSADVDAILDEVVERGLAVLKYVWEESGPAEQAVLAAMVTASGEGSDPVTEDQIAQAWLDLGVIMPAGEMAKAIKSLIVRDVILDRGGYCFTVELQRRWLEKYERLEWVKEEIAETIARWQQVAPPPPAGPTFGENVLRYLTSWRTWVIVTPLVFILVWLLLTFRLDLGFSRRSEAPVETAAGVSTATANAQALTNARATAEVLQILLAEALESGDETEAQAYQNELSDVQATAEALEARQPIEVVSVPAGDLARVNDLVVVGDTIWAATEGGLVRWTLDGRGQTVAAEDLGFPDGCVNTIDVAADNSIWIACGGAAHFRVDGSTIRALGYFDRDSGLKKSVIRALKVEQDGETVMAGGPMPSKESDTPLSYFDGSEWINDVLPFDDPVQSGLDVSISSILRSDDLTLWLGLENDGILRWDGQGWTHWPPFAFDSGTEGNRIRRLIQTADGSILAAAGEWGLLIFNHEVENWEPVDIPPEITAISDVAQFADGQIVVAGSANERDFVAQLQGGFPELGPGLEQAHDLHGLVQSSDGRIWVGAFDGGVFVFDGQEWIAMQ